MGKIVLMAIKDATRNFDKLYSYRVPQDFPGSICVGIRVFVPFGNANKDREGFIFKVINEGDYDGLNEENKDSVKADWDPAKIKEIRALIDEKPIMSLELIKLAEYVKEKYICTYYDALRIMLPIFSPAAKEKTIKAVTLAKPHDEIVEEIESNRFNRIQQIRVLEMLLENEFIGITDIQIFAGVSRSVLQTLKKNGYVDIVDVEVLRDPLSHINVARSMPLKPTDEQEIVISECGKIINEERAQEILLHGITGSGKTEVYLQLIQMVIDKGKQAIVLVPEISLTPQMVSRFKARFGDEVAVLHSRLSPGERYDQWRAIKENRRSVAVGARSAIFAPFNNIGIIVIDEEHEQSYKSETTPKYEAKHIARQRSIEHKALLIYGSATPSVEMYYKAINGEIMIMKIINRAKNSKLPKVNVVDMRAELEKGNRSVFSELLQLEMKKNIEKMEQTMLFLNRRGYASFLMCRTCGKSVNCDHCNVSMTYHMNSNRLICHYCGYTLTIPIKCPACQSKNIKPFGTGTQKIEDEVKRDFNASVIRMDMDTTTGKNSHEILLNRFRDENTNVMIGTQMIAKGHDFPSVTLVGVLAADALLNTGDYRATERTFQLLTQVAGRAGRGELTGRVVVQSYNIDHYSILCAMRHNYEEFYNCEISLREKMLYPPFMNIGLIIISGTDDNASYKKGLEVFELCRKFAVVEKAKLTLTKPLRSPISRIKDRFRWRIIIKAEDGDKLTRVLTKVSDEFYSSSKKNREELSMDINPYNML